jgi:hypothetical protein
MPARASKGLDHNAVEELDKLHAEWGNESDKRVTRSATSKAMHALKKAQENKSQEESQ